MKEGLRLTFRTLAWALLPGMALTLGACARYHALPLGSRDIARPLTAVEISAGRISAPLLPAVRFQGGPLTPDQVALLAVAGNLRLRETRDRLRVAQAQVLIAGLLPNPTLGLGFSLPLGNTAGLSRGYSAGLGFDLGALLTRPLRRRVARTAEQSVALSVAWQEWQVAENAKLDALQLQSLTQAAGLARRLSHHAQRQSKRLVAALASHDISLVDVDAARASATSTRLAWLRLEMHAAKLRARLDEALGLAPGTVVPLADCGRGDPWAQVPPVAHLLRYLAHRRPDLLALRYGYHSANAALREAIWGQFPDIAVTLTRARDTTDVNTISPGVSVSLPIFNHSQGAIALARASRRELFDAYRARVFEARADVLRLDQDLSDIERRIRLARKNTTIQGELALVARRSFRRGDLGAISFYATQSRATVSALELLRLERVRNVIGVALEVASGRYFESPVQRVQG